MSEKNKRISRLTTQTAVCKEFRHIYRETRLGAIDLNTAKTLGWLLKNMAELMQSEELEKKIEQLSLRVNSISKLNR